MNIGIQNANGMQVSDGEKLDNNTYLLILNQLFGYLPNAHNTQYTMHNRNFNFNLKSHCYFGFNLMLAVIIKCSEKPIKMNVLQWVTWL